jgi:hypothetical protein
MSGPGAAARAEHGPRHPAGSPHGLAALGLTAEDYRALAQQGFVSPERRAGGPYYKLRFRRDGRQVVTCLGKDHAAAQAVAKELRTLQAPARLGRHLRRLTIEARRTLQSPWSSGSSVTGDGAPALSSLPRTLRLAGRLAGTSKRCPQTGQGRLVLPSESWAVRNARQVGQE